MMGYLHSLHDIINERLKERQSYSAEYTESVTESVTESDTDSTDTYYDANDSFNNTDNVQYIHDILNKPDDKHTVDNNYITSNAITKECIYTDINCETSYIKLYISKHKFGEIEIDIISNKTERFDLVISSFVEESLYESITFNIKSPSIKIVNLDVWNKIPINTDVTINIDKTATSLKVINMKGFVTYSYAVTNGLNSVIRFKNCITPATITHINENEAIAKPYNKYKIRRETPENETDIHIMESTDIIKSYEYIGSSRRRMKIQFHMERLTNN
jgi:hypothetical protein